MKPWCWVRSDLVYAVHDMQLARHGGLDGIHDKNSVESALSVPEQLDAYSNSRPDAADLAAAYAYGFACNQGFRTGNKGTTWLIARVFLADNSFNMRFSDIDAIHTMEAVSDGTMGEKQLAQWFRQHIL